jgi:CHAD domain-containing protein
VKLLTRLARLQDILGSINDAATAGQLLESRGGAPRTRALLEARGVVLGWGRGRTAMQRSDLRAAWKAFRAAKRFW